MDILIPEREIVRRVAELGAEITAFYRSKPLTAVVVMNGALLFGADLIRKIKLPLRIDTFAADSYVSDRSGGELHIRAELKNSPAGRHILLVDDILDTGLTLKKITAHLLACGALSVRVCVLLNKNNPDRRGPEPDWTGFNIPQKYVIGCGMDSGEEYRTLPYIAVK